MWRIFQAWRRRAVAVATLRGGARIVRVVWGQRVATCSTWSVYTSMYRDYSSSMDSSLRLYGSFLPAGEPAPILLRMHGWHGQVKQEHPDNVMTHFAGVFNHVKPEMRGRGDSGGRPDANGWELQDAVDAVAAHRGFHPEVSDAGAPLLWGGSGGGGNVLGLLGKFPDTFAAAVCECGISDYGLWYAHDRVGEFRDELEGDGWIGGNPVSNAEAYLSRGGRTTAHNLLTPLLMVHGEEDARVPFEQAKAYVEAARTHGKGTLVELVAFAGVGNPGHYSGLDAAGEARRKAAIARHLAAHRGAPALPARGTLVVAGYLRTRHFAIELESVDHVGWLAYDLASGDFRVEAPTSRTATLHVQGTARTLACEPLTLAALCERLAIPITPEVPIG